MIFYRLKGAEIYYIMVIREDFGNCRNAREELEELLKPGAIVCANLIFGSKDKDDEVFFLRKDHTPDEYENFLSNIDRTYNPCGTDSDLRGTIWLTGGSWYERVSVIDRETPDQKRFYWSDRIATSLYEAPPVPEKCERQPNMKSATKR